jgi:D-beta-D-heptose 7-phosphate kinase/D-beta-D-heptose 1-phosphate adenosyltransferase
MTFIDTVREFRGLRALVIGDLMLDTYLEGQAKRLCREAPVPIIERRSEQRALGGAANAAANLQALGADVTLIGVVGADESAADLRKTLNSHSIPDDCLICDPDYSTLHKLRIVADDQYVARFDTGNAWTSSHGLKQELLGRLESAYQQADVIVVSDYGYGVLSTDVRGKIGALRRDTAVPLIVDAKNLRQYRTLPITGVTPNHLEAAGAVNVSAGEGTVDLPAAEQVAVRLLGLLDQTRVAAITLGAGGVMLLERGRQAVHIPAHPVPRPNDVGAGDSFTAALALALATGSDAQEAARLAVEASGIAVAKTRTAVVEQSELLQRVSVLDLAAGTHLKELVSRLTFERMCGKRIVFSNGVFDILHAGHVQLLRSAKALGDVLVVGVNSDESTRRLKGPGRPVNAERDRAALVAALEPVDHVLVFDDDTPECVIRSLMPDVHVKGGDYEGQNLPEALAVEECGGETVILPLAEGLSTSTVIRRIADGVSAKKAGAA